MKTPCAFARNVVIYVIRKCVNMKYMFDWKNNIKEEELNNVIDVIKNDGLIVVPTETVYGIAANALSDEACKKIFIAKGRASDNPLIVHVSDKSMIKRLVKNISDVEEKLIDAFMPGPFTLILEKKDCISSVASAGGSTIGIRMPSNKIINKIIKESNIPLAAPSANISGRPSGTCVDDILEELKSKVDIVIDGGQCNIGIESTVVKVINNIPTVLRPGYITERDIKNVIGEVSLSKNLFKEIKQNDKVESPGMKYRHYAPKTKCILVEKNEKQIENINKLLLQYSNVCIIGFEEDKKLFNSAKYINVGSKYNLKEVAKNIFSALRKVDRLDVDVAIVEAVEKEGIGLSIMNRLVRACENNIVY